MYSVPDILVFYGRRRTTAPTERVIFGPEQWNVKMTFIGKPVVSTGSRCRFLKSLRKPYSDEQYWLQRSIQIVDN